MSRFFKELLEVRADRWRYLFGVGSAWSIIIPVVIVAAILINAYAVSKYQYDSSDLKESYWDGYNAADSEHEGDYDSGYNSGYDAGFEEGCEIGYDEGYSKAKSDMAKGTYNRFAEAFTDGYHSGFQDGSGDHTSGLISEKEFVSCVEALRSAWASLPAD